MASIRKPANDIRKVRKSDTLYEILMPGIAIMVSELESAEGSEPSTSKGYGTVFHFRFYRGQDVVGWLVLVPQSKKLVRLKTRYLDNIENYFTDRFYKYLESWAKKRGFDKVETHTTAPGASYFQCLGYETAEILESDSELCTHIMRKDLGK